MEHAGYVHIKALLDNPSKKYAGNYYQLLKQKDRELLRGCLASFHDELTTRKRRYEDLQKLAETLEKSMGAANLVRELSSDSEVESPRDKRAKKFEESKTAKPTGWFTFGSSAVPLPSASSTTTGPAKV